MASSSYDEKASYIAKVVAIILGSVLLISILVKYIWSGSFAWQDVVLLVTGALLVVSPILVKIAISKWGTITFRKEEVRAQSTLPPDPRKEAQHFGQNPELAEAREALLQDSPEQAIRILEKLVQREPGYTEEFLAALTLSPNRRDWQKARALLPKFGKPRHYLRLGYYSFQENDLSIAVELTEKGLLLAEASDRAEDQKLVAKFKNNLAYYYSLLGRQDLGERALQYANSALTSKLEDGSNAEALAGSFDTLGLVQIVFGRSRQDVEEGLKNLEEARRLGGRPDMYFRHVELAKNRLGELPKDGREQV